MTWLQFLIVLITFPIFFFLRKADRTNKTYAKKPEPKDVSMDEHRKKSE